MLYEIDMRLRPSGRAGPVASSLVSFADYQANEAWTWEHMALTRARVMSASPEFRERIERIIRDVLTRRRDPATTANDVADMRRAIAQEKGESDHLGPQIRRRRHGRYRLHRAISPARARP